MTIAKSVCKPSQVFLLKRRKPFNDLERKNRFFPPASKGKGMGRSSPVSERYFWVHKVEKLVFLLASCHNVDFWAQGMMGASLSSTPPWCQGEVRRVPEGRLSPLGEVLAVLCLIHFPSWCKHLGGAHPSLAGPPPVSAREDAEGDPQP